MRSLLRYIINNYAFLLFLLLEVISLLFVFNYNKYQRVQYLNSSNRVTGAVYNSYNSVVKYFNLISVNSDLAEENARLKSYFASKYEGNVFIDSMLVNDGKIDSSFSYISASIINNSVNKAHNYITLNKGRKHGVKPDQGVVTANGIVGVVTNVSESFSSGFSVLNSRWGPSGKLKDSDYFGPIEWDGEDYQMTNLKEIPFHVKLAVGDTIVTSGYSSFFPEGLIIGTISSFSQPEGGSFYNIRVKLAVDFKSINFVDIIDNLKREELMELENNIEDGAGNN
jgi:rod shape-determining protein MreC